MGDRIGEREDDEKRGAGSKTEADTRVAIDMSKILDLSRKSKKHSPALRYYEDISEVVRGAPNVLPATLTVYRELHAKFTLMSDSMRRQQEGMNVRLDSLRAAVEVVLVALAEQTAKTDTNVELSEQSGASSAASSVATPIHPLKCLEKELICPVSDCLYARAKVTDPSKLMLWLGSNVLMEYSPAEAKEVLEGNCKTLEEQIAEVAEEILFLREQITTAELAISRLHNYGVSQRSASASEPRAVAAA